MSWQWAPATGVAAVSALFAGLTYRALRRNNHGMGWSVTNEQKPAGDPVAGRHIVVHRTSGPAVHDVTVEIPDVKIQTGGPTRDRLDPGGHIDLLIAEKWGSRADTVTVSWRGKFGRRRSWRSGI